MRRLLPFIIITACAQGQNPEPTPSPVPSATIHLPKVEDAGLDGLPPNADVEEDFSKILGWWESAYQGAGNRAKNVYLAGSAIDGRRLSPGAEFSFNETVGERSLSRGYLFAPVITNGEMENGLGGGVCQVSSTVYAAVLTAGLEITERIPHSRPSSYMPIGLDATVSFPAECKGNARSKECYAPDLRFRNDGATTILLHMTTRPDAKRRGYTVLRVEILGSSEPFPRPTYAYGAKKREAFTRRMKIVDGKDGDYAKRTQKGLDGMLVTGSFSRVLSDGTTKIQTIRTEYPTTDEVWEVGAGRTSDAPPPWAQPKD